MDGGEAEKSSGPRPRWRLRLAVVAAGVVVLGVFAVFAARYQASQQLLMANPDTLVPDSTLVRRASANGETAFQAHCASCHGRDMKGSQTRGVPDLTDAIWLYDFGRV